MCLHMSEEICHLEHPESASESKLSKFTLTSGENDEPVLRENNAYLNDNVD